MNWCEINSVESDLSIPCPCPVSMEHLARVNTRHPRQSTINYITHWGGTHRGFYRCSPCCLVSFSVEDSLWLKDGGTDYPLLLTTHYLHRLTTPFIPVTRVVSLFTPELCLFSCFVSLCVERKPSAVVLPSSPALYFHWIKAVTRNVTWRPSDRETYT